MPVSQGHSGGVGEREAEVWGLGMDSCISQHDLYFTLKYFNINVEFCVCAFMFKPPLRVIR